MRGLRSLVAVVVAAALLVVPVSVADAVGDANPVITAPSGKHYNGFTGPFTVDFDNAPIVDGGYDYFVDKVPSGGGAPVLVGTKKKVDFNGSITVHQLSVTPLSPGTGYAFHVTDNAGHEATLAFTVSTGTPPVCSIVLPGTVRMKARSFLVNARLSSTCAALNTKYAAWEARHPVGGFAQTFIFDAVSTDTWRIYDDERTGVYTVRPRSAKNTADETVPQNTARLVLKMDSRISLTGSRSGGYVTLRTTSARYSPSANKYVRWGNRNVVLAYRTCTACAWKQLKVRTTNRNGVTSYRFRAVKARQYRASAAGTASTWAPRPDHLTR